GIHQLEWSRAVERERKLRRSDQLGMHLTVTLPKMVFQHVVNVVGGVSNLGRKDHERLGGEPRYLALAAEVRIQAPAAQQLVIGIEHDGAAILNAIGDEGLDPQNVLKGFDAV